MGSAHTAACHINMAVWLYGCEAVERARAHVQLTTYLDCHLWPTVIGSTKVDKTKIVYRGVIAQW